MSEVCHYCFGRCKLPDEGYADCPYCDGKGFITVDETEDEDFEEGYC